jgi:membrane protease YdiL (CAAX protease family)
MTEVWFYNRRTMGGTRSTPAGSDKGGMVGAGCPPVQQGYNGSGKPLGASLFSDATVPRPSLSLLVETVAAVAVVVALVRVFGARWPLGLGWLMNPGILVVAALAPIWFKGRRFAPFGVSDGQLKRSLVVLGWTCGLVFPLAFCGLWLLKILGWDVFSMLVLTREQNWTSWLAYQFMYIAVAEEVFFRGYVQINILGLVGPALRKWPWRRQWVSIVVSAGCFALAHVIIQGRIAAVLTFLPGLVLGWLFVRTEGLLTPILFHGSANVFYLLMGNVLAQISGPGGGLHAALCPVTHLALLWR